MSGIDNQLILGCLMNDKISGAQKKLICNALGVEREQLDLRLGEAGRAFTAFKKNQKEGTLD